MWSVNKNFKNLGLDCGHVDAESFKNRCIDEIKIGHVLLNGLFKKTAMLHGAEPCGRIADIQLLSTNLTPAYVEVEMPGGHLWKRTRRFYPFANVTEITDSSVMLRVNGTADNNSNPGWIDDEAVPKEMLISLRQKLSDAERCFGWRWKVEYEDNHFNQDPFRQGMFW